MRKINICNDYRSLFLILILFLFALSSSSQINIPDNNGIINLYSKTLDDDFCLDHYFNLVVKSNATNLFILKDTLLGISFPNDIFYLIAFEPRFFMVSNMIPNGKISQYSETNNIANNSKIESATVFYDLDRKAEEAVHSVLERNFVISFQLNPDNSSSHYEDFETG